MKITVQMEDPDALHDAIWEAAGGCIPEDLPDEEHFERTQSAEAREAQYREAISAWADDDGQVRLEFDLGADPPSARVLRRDGKDELHSEAVLRQAVEVLRKIDTTGAENAAREIEWILMEGGAA